MVIRVDGVLEFGCNLVRLTISDLIFSASVYSMVFKFDISEGRTPATSRIISASTMLLFHSRTSEVSLHGVELLAHTLQIVIEVHHLAKIVDELLLVGIGLLVLFSATAFTP